MGILDRLSSSSTGSGTGWAARLSASAPTVVAVVMVVALAAQLAALAWRFLAPAPPPEDTGAVAVAPATGATIANVVNAHLFGSAALQATGDPSAAPTTNLRLVLAGTLAGNDPAQGWAIIGESGQAARVFQTGATLPGGARLREVHADRVILERSGRLESLPLPRLSSGGAPTPVMYPQGAQLSPDMDSLSAGVRQLIAQNPSAVSDFIRPQPVFAGGQQKGYRVYPGRNRSQFAALGLMPGDLVTAVNGAPLDDPNRGLETLRGMNAGGPVILTVERNGQVQQVTVDTTAMPVQPPGANPPPPQPDSDEFE